MMSTAPRFYIALLNGEVLNSQQVDFPYRFQCILSHPYLIRGLGCVVATVDQLEFLRPLLTQQMPCLELLDIRVKQSTGPESVCLGGPMLDLSTARLMAVKRLRLDGIAVDMAAPFLCGLRHLILNQHPGIERHLPLSQFVASISTFRRLETLELRNYSGFLVTKTTQPVDPVHLPSLKKLGICDTPSVTASLLQVLYLPADATLHVIADIKGFYPDDLGDLFSLALPADKKTLPILKDIKRVDVNLIGSTFSFIGMTLKGAKITFEIDLDLEFTLGLIARDHVYEATVRSLDRIFADSPLCYIGLSGDLACLTARSWRAAFAPFPDLERLKLEDIGKHGAGALSLLEVLGSPAGTPAQMPCPKLDTLCMRGGAYGFELLDESEACLMRRQTATCTPLKRLWLGLGLHVQDDKARLQLCRKTLAQTVEFFTIQPVTC